MNRSQYILKNEGGFALVVALMVMVILSLIGIAGLNTSIFEQQIAGNDWNTKRSFYRADGGLSIGSEVLEQNFACIDGFNNGSGTQFVLEGTVAVKERNGNDMKIWANAMMNDSAIVAKLDNPTADYDVAFPSDAGGVLPSKNVGYLYFGGETSLVSGAALSMAAGYEGKGKSAAQGGIAKNFDIYSQFIGPKGSESIVATTWRHMVGTEGSCHY